MNNRGNRSLATFLLKLALLLHTDHSALRPWFSGPRQAQVTPSLDVVGSGIAWIGTTTSYADEWVELYNNTEADVSLENWCPLTLPRHRPAKHHPRLRPHPLEAHGRCLSPPSGRPDLHDGLHNAGEVITLTNAVSNVSAMVGQSGAMWFVGDSPTKGTMVRSAQRGVIGHTVLPK